MLALMASHRGEFAKDTASVLSGKRLVAIPHCCRQLLLRHSAYASRQAIGSQFFGVILLRQCVPTRSCLAPRPACPGKCRAVGHLLAI